MNYQRIYDNIMERAKTRVLVGYGENHHIIPKCLGGINIKSNRVRLTSKEHYLAHFLLSKIYPDSYKLVYAFWMMCNGSKINRPSTNAAMYKVARELFSSTMKKRISPMKGKTHTEQTRLKISLSKQGQDFWTGRKHKDISKKRMSNSAIGRKASEETRQKMSKYRTGLKLSEENKQNIAKAKLGEKNPQAKLTIEKVRRIRAEYKETKTSQSKLGVKYGVARTTIQHILNNIIWRE